MCWEWHQSTLVMFLCVGRLAVGLLGFSRSFLRKKARQENCPAPNDPDPLNFVFDFDVTVFEYLHFILISTRHCMVCSLCHFWVAILNSICAWQSSGGWCLWMEASPWCLCWVNGRQGGKALVMGFSSCQLNDIISQAPFLVLSIAALGIFSFLVVCLFQHFLPYRRTIWHRSSGETELQPSLTLRSLSG